VHCRQFAPTWRKVEAHVNGKKFLDSTQKPVRVRAIRVNCVDFDTECRQQNVRGYPTIRVYKRQIGTPWTEEYRGGDRTPEKMGEWMQTIVGKSNFHHEHKTHRAFSSSCRVKGFIDVPRVAGTLQIHAGRSETQELALPYTNVSHIIHGLSFGQHRPEDLVHLERKYKEFEGKLIITGKAFGTQRMHHAPVHYLQIVNTKLEEEDMRLYQISHQQRDSHVAKTAIPAAKFSFDIAPVQVVWEQAEKRWFSLLTSVFGVVGGTFTTIWMTWGYFENFCNKHAPDMNAMI